MVLNRDHDVRPLDQFIAQLANILRLLSIRILDRLAKLQKRQESRNEDEGYTNKIPFVL